MKKYNPLIILMLAGLFLFGCETTPEKRKIRLAANEDSMNHAESRVTTIQLEPKERRSIAVLFFKNKTGDKNLGWLQKGLTEMFIRALSQSNSISILSTDRLFEIMKRLNKEKTPKYNLNMAALIAQEANVEVLLTGSITKSGDSLMLNVKLHEPKQGMIIKEEAIEGRGLENLFEMVDHLTTRIKDDLLLTFDKEPPVKGIAELSSNSLEAWRHYTAGMEAKNKFFHNDAISELNQALEYDSTFIAAYLGIASVYMNQGQQEEAFQAFKVAKSLKNKATPREHFQIDWFDAAFTNDLQKLLETNRAWIQQYPNDRDANQNMANFYYSQHNFRNAVKYYQKVRNIDPKFTLALNQMGYAYANLGQFQKAFKVMEEYKKINSDEPNPYDSTGDIYLLAGEFSVAEKNYRKALEIRNDFVASWQNLASIYLQQGEYPKALEAVEQYLNHAGEGNTKTRGYLFKAAVFWRQKKYREAMSTYEAVLKIHPLHPHLIQRVSQIFEILGDSTAARENLEKYYGIIYEEMNSGVMAYQSLLSLFQLSLWNEIRIQDTIALLEKFRDDSQSNKILHIQARFLLSLLYIENDDLAKLDGVWDDVVPVDIMKVFREIGNFSYTNLWAYYKFTHDFFRQQPESGIQNYEQFLKFAMENNLKHVESIYRMFLVDLLLRKNQADEAQKHLKLSGMPLEETWMVCGPFENTNGFNRKFPPEKKIDLTQAYPGGLRWHTARDSSLDGFINLRENIRQSNWSVGYGLVYIEAPTSKKVQFRLGSNEAIKVWLNDKLVWKMNAIREAAVDSDVFEVDLRKGKNKVLVKVGNTFGNWGYYFRVTDSTGKGIPEIEFVSPKAASVSALSD